MDKKMKPEESIDIIGKMMSETRKSVLRLCYVPFLTWGGATLVVSMSVYILLLSYNNYLINLCWFLIPILGFILTQIFKPHGKPVKTGITVALQSIWCMLGILMIIFSISAFLIEFNILFFILLFLSIGSFVSGAVISYPFMKYSSLPGFIMSVVMLMLPYYTQIPLFAAAIAIMMIVPGYRMKQDLNIL